MKLVYICHPLAGNGSPEWGDRARNVERYLAFCAYAMEPGHAVISWAHHELLYERGHRDVSYWLDRDVALLAKADEVWLCGPVAVSHGMRVEEEHARAEGIPIRHEPEWDDPTYRPPTSLSGHGGKPA